MATFPDSGALPAFHRQSLSPIKSDLSTPYSASDDYPFPTDPETHGGDARAILAQLRADAESTIERLISFLDELDGDPDAEPDHDFEDCNYHQPIYAGPCTVISRRAA